MTQANIGQIVVIAGTTGSGKTTTCRTLLAQAEDVWMHFGIDLVVGTTIDRKYVDGGSCANEGVQTGSTEPGGPAVLSVGTYGKRLINAMHHMAVAAARCGQNVVMDHVPTLNPPLLPACVAALKGLPVLFVALKPPRDVLMARIDARLPEVIKILGPEQGPITNEGCKRASDYIYKEIFTHDRFDLVLDTAELSPKDVVAAIFDRLREGPGTAFAALARQLHV